MNRRLSLFFALVAGIFASLPRVAFADGRPGSVEWSDGRKMAGGLSLTPGKELRLFTSTAQISLQLSEVTEIRFSPEKEEMRATQAKTGEVYPVRYLKTQITLADGKVLDGHLFTTTFYVETDDATEKVVLMAKQTGADGQKLADLSYPTLIHFDTPGIRAGSSQIDLTSFGFLNPQPPVAVARPDLGLLPCQQLPGKAVWTVPSGEPGKLLFSVQAADGVHVAWPGPAADPSIQQAVQASLQEMQDFYDTRTLLGCFADLEEEDVYSLVLLKRMGTTYSFSANRKPWSLVILRWKYDPEMKKTTLLNRVSLLMGRAEGNSLPPAVFKQPELLQAVSVLPATPPPLAP